MRGGPDPRRGPARPTKQAARARRPYIWCSRMGLPFTSGHILALRRFPASSVGPPFRSVWHRDPSGRWTFFQDVPSVQGCARYFGAAVAEVVAATIEIAWDGPRRFSVTVTGSGRRLDWSLTLTSPFPDLEIVIEKQLEAGDTVVTEMRFTGTQTAPMTTQQGVTTAHRPPRRRPRLRPPHRPGRADHPAHRLLRPAALPRPAWAPARAGAELRPPWRSSSTSTPRA